MKLDEALLGIVMLLITERLLKTGCARREAALRY